jgi:SNF2 family DNA or RNA helicase
MDFRREQKAGHLRGLTLQELCQRSVTTNPPAPSAHERSLEDYVSSPSPPAETPRGSDANSSDAKPLCCPANSTPSVLIQQPATTTRYPSSPTIRNAGSWVYSRIFIFGGNHADVVSRSSLSSPPQYFDFTFPSPFVLPPTKPEMVREVQPARNPLAPAMGNSQPPPDVQEGAKKPLASDNTASRPLYPTLQNVSIEHPQFGKPSMPGASPQPLSRTQPLVRPSSGPNISAPRQDKYSNLFVTAKKPSQRPELHKPQSQKDPLQAFKSGQIAAPTSNRPSSQSTARDDDFYEISKPPSLPTWQPKPFVPPTFSSQQPPNQFFRPQNPVDLTREDPIPSSSTYPSIQSSFSSTQYEANDPYTYMDSAKANEEIKALLEGALEDEEDMPRLRRRKKQFDDNLADITDKVKSLAVKSEPNAEGTEASGDQEEDGTVEGLKVKLLPHQIDGVDWMVNKESGKKPTKGGILADDMGLGKTIQSIALILSNPKPSADELAKRKQKLPETLGKGTLVVAPLALIKQWEGEIKDRIEQDHALKVCVHHGPQRTKSYKELKKYDVVITTYQTLSSEHAGCSETLRVGCFGVHWYRIILDEAHSIKNRNAKSTKAACDLNAHYRWCLTGTPMQNNLDELQSLIHFLQIKPYCDLQTWRDNIDQPMKSGRAGLAFKRLRLILKGFMKRRTKDILKQDGKSGKDGAKDSKDPGFKIVARTVENIEAEFTLQEQEFYNRLESRTDRSLEQMMAGNKLSYASALVLLMRLRQACNHPKLTGSDLSAETDVTSGSQTPSRSRAGRDDDMDSIANMLGGLSVETKLCDMCQIELTPRKASKGAIRCSECQQDLDKQSEQVTSIMQAKKEKRHKQERKTVTAQRKQARRVIVDSDDEDEDEHAEAEEDAASSTDDDDNDEDDDEAYSSSEESSTSHPTVMQSTKIRHLLHILKEDCHTHKYIVFSFFTSMLDLIEPFLHASRIHYVRYDGKMRNDAREASLASLRNDPSTRVLLCSLRAGSLGLNLTAASRVIILEPFWNPFVEEQAIDRVHRLNQTQDVKVYKMTIKNTVEQRILELQEKKRELAKHTIEGQGVQGKGAMKLSMQDMLKLFRHDAEDDHPIEVGPANGAKGVQNRQASALDMLSDLAARGSGRLERPSGREWQQREVRRGPVGGGWSSGNHKPRTSDR